METPQHYAELEQLMRSGIPLARAMELRIVGYDGERLALSAPLAPNVNDKGCAFGGSIGSLLTLAAWGLITLKLGERGIAAEVYIRDAELKFSEPVWDSLNAEAWLVEPDWDALLESLSAGKKTRCTMLAEVVGENGAAAAARQKSSFVLLPQVEGTR